MKGKTKMKRKIVFSRSGDFKPGKGIGIVARHDWCVISLFTGEIICGKGIGYGFWRAICNFVDCVRYERNGG